ncbi:hypothetical protein M8J77_005869 [Diaphorina citri]|nr:hypothetical protein M8J77_005869 [Diaphorina citri]
MFSSTQNSTLVTPTADDHVYRVAVKPPPFWKNKPSIWFAQMEAQFRTSGVTADQTMFDYLISAVDSEILESVSDLILNPPAVEKYKTLKDRLIEHFSGSETQRFQHLLSAQEFGDKKPSELLQHMIDLCPALDAKFLKTLWLQQLPSSLRPVLTAQNIDLRSLGKLADDISSSLQDHHVKAVESSSTQSDVLERLSSQMENLSASLEVLKIQQRKPFRSRPFQARRSEAPEDICWYHKKFGRYAQQCLRPCNWYRANKSLFTCVRQK